jgi:hypothetical protein
MAIAVSFTSLSIGIALARMPKGLPEFRIYHLSIRMLGHVFGWYESTTTLQMAVVDELNIPTTLQALHHGWPF